MTVTLAQIDIPIELIFEKGRAVQLNKLEETSGTIVGYNYPSGK